MMLTVDDGVAEVRAAVGNFVETSCQRENLSKHRGTCVASESVIQSFTKEQGRHGRSLQRANPGEP